MATSAKVAAVRPLLDRERALQHVWSRPFARWSRARAPKSLAWSPRAPEVHQRAGHFRWSRPYARSLIASARSSMSRSFAWVAQVAVRVPEVPSAAATFVWSRPCSRSDDRERALQYVALLGVVA